MSCILQVNSYTASFNTYEELYSKLKNVINKDNFMNAKIILLTDVQYKGIYIFNDNATKLVNTAKVVIDTKEINEKLFPKVGSNTKSNTNNKKPYLLINNKTNVVVNASFDEITNHITLDNYNDIKIVDTQLIHVYIYDEESKRYKTENGSALLLDLQHILDDYCMAITFDNKIYFIKDKVIKWRNDEPESNQMNMFCLNIRKEVLELLENNTINEIKKITISKNGVEIGEINEKGLLYKNEILWSVDKLNKVYQDICQKYFSQDYWSKTIIELEELLKLKMLNQSKNCSFKNINNYKEILINAIKNIDKFQ